MQTQTSSPSDQALQQILAVQTHLNLKFVNRADAINKMIIAALTRLPIVFLGPPGVAKSAMVNAIAEYVWDDDTGETASYFYKALTQHTHPDELFGPTSLRTYKVDDVLRRNTQGMMSEARFAFFDEIFKASGPTMNELLTVLNEWVLVNGGVVEKTNALTVYAASNEVPGPEMAALWDRFALRVIVQPIERRGKKDEFGSLLRFYRDGSPQTDKPKLTVEQIMIARESIGQVRISDNMLLLFQKYLIALDDEGVRVSDRRIGLLGQLLQASAWLRGSNEVEDEDLTILTDAVWSDPNPAAKQFEAIKRVLLATASPVTVKAQEIADEAGGIYAALIARINALNEDAKKQQVDPTTRGNVLMTALRNIKVQRTLLQDIVNDARNRGKPQKTLETLGACFDSVAQLVDMIGQMITID